jgi:nucleoside-diphosphate-sugar epimerase
MALRRRRDFRSRPLVSGFFDVKRVLVTGARGFAGRHCLPRLAALGYDVHALSSRAQPGGDAITWHRGDLLQPSCAAELSDAVRATHLLHLAWITEPGKYWSAADNARWLRGSLALLEEFARAGGRRAVIAGSCAEYDWRHGYCFEDTTPLLPATLYGRCKRALFEAAQPLASELGIEIAWARLFFLYGPGERPERVFPSVIRSLLSGVPANCTRGDQIRDFLYIDDAAAALVALVDHAAQGAFNVASGQPLALRDVLANIAEKLQRPDLLRLGALPACADEPALLVGDVHKLANQLGWTPSTSLDDGLARTIQWWRARQ